jgi:hypothetical protein
MMKDFLKILVFISVIIFTSCSGSDRQIPDIKDSPVSLEFHHFYKFFPGEPGYFKPDSVLNYYKEFPRFFDIFSRYVISIGGPEKKDFLILANAFCYDPMIRGTYNDCKKIHGDLKGTEEELQKAFGFYNYYFPSRPIPDIYFYQSGFNQSVIIDSCILGIAIDKYLGQGYELYAKLGLPRYQCSRMIPEMMVPDAMRAWIESEFPFPDSSLNLLNAMVYNGKIQYLLEHVLPYYHDTTLFAFSGKQWEWCEKNEIKMWTFYIENKKLFDTNPMEVKRFTDDGPFTNQFSNESPARTGVWTGWRIVKMYMENNPGVSLETLMKENDGQKILVGSGYNP